MLNLTRKLDQIVVITSPQGEQFRVQVRRIEPGRVMLGFDFPQDYAIHREELLTRGENGKHNGDRTDRSPVESDAG